MLKGATSKDEGWKYNGVNLGTNTLKTALDNLHKYRILVRIGTARHPKGQCYQLVKNESDIDWERLKARKWQKTMENKRRTQNARKQKEEAITLVSDKRAGNSCVGQESYSCVGQDSTLVSDKRVTLVSDKGIQTHSKTQVKTTTTEIRSESEEKREKNANSDFVVVVDDSSSNGDKSEKKGSFLDIKGFPHLETNYDASKDQELISQIGEEFGLAIAEIEQFMWERNPAKNPDAKTYIESLEELKKGLEWSKQHMSRQGSILGFVRHRIFHGKFVPSSKFVPEQEGRQKGVVWTPEMREQAKRKRQQISK